MKTITDDRLHLSQDDFCDLFNDLVDDLPKFKEWAKKHIWFVDELTAICKDATYTNVILGIESIIELYEETIN